MGKELKRMNYFDGLLLKENDYKMDKEYQRRLQGFHNRYLHTWGIICGLEVRPVTDSEMEVFVTEGSAIDLTDEGNYGSDVKESISRQIVIYEGHPDNPVDLSEYKSGTDVYVFVNYSETGADRDVERGQGEEIHIWERGRIYHSTDIPDNKKDIILARVVPRTVVKKADDGNGNMVDVEEVVIDSTCIFDTYADGTPLRVYAGPYANVLELEKFRFKIGDDILKMPNLYDVFNADLNENHLIVDSDITKFTGDVEISNDLQLDGELISKKDGVIENEFQTEEAVLQLNSRDEDGTSPDLWKPRDGGLEVFRGGPNVAPDARIVWSESGMVWKAGLGNELNNIVYNADWEKLRYGDFGDGLHYHSKLYSTKGLIMSVNDEGNISSNIDLTLKDKDIQLKNGALAWYGDNKNFSGLSVDGPVLAGTNGGLLGTTENGEKAVLFWDKNNVGIGAAGISDDKLNVAGSTRLLSGLNPVRFTSEWTAFPDLTINQAEICNDTTNHKALMIVGNQSAGQSRKVAIWDRLDVNGMLYINGNMQLSQDVLVSAGSGNNGIIFPSDPGGGGWDSAWIKYYPRSGEACTLEVGTSNDGDDNISLMAAGGVGIGTYAPDDKLEVRSQLRIMSGSNPIRFTSSWSGFPEQAANHSEICNETGYFHSLMIAGNRSGGSERRVSIWDHLDVNGPLAVSGILQVKGAIIPGVGNCEVKGIMFQKDPYGGSGDAAWIRYYSDTLRGGGENMTLELGISNDTNKETIVQSYWVSSCPWNIPNGCGYWANTTRVVFGNNGDRLKLHASGGVYVDGNFYYTSSRAYKENISQLDKTIVKDALDSIEPVQFNFIGDNKKTTMGFIAENMPDALAAHDKKAISPMEIIAVLVGEVKEQEAAIKKLKKKITALKG